MTERLVGFAIFDMDGVVFDTDPSGWREVSRLLGCAEEDAQYEFMFAEGKIDCRAWCELTVGTWTRAGLSRRMYLRAIQSIGYMNGTAFCFRELNRRGYEIAVISEGLEDLGHRLRKEMELKNVLCASRLVFRGQVLDHLEYLFDGRTKGEVLQDFLRSRNHGQESVVVVGDNVNDIPMFRIADVCVAFRPKCAAVASSADHVIREKQLARVLDFV